MNKEALEELKFCLKLWKEKGYCEFGQKTKCEECAAPYVLLKMINGEVIHGPDKKRLTLKEWEEKIQSLG